MNHGVGGTRPTVHDGDGQGRRQQILAPVADAQAPVQRGQITGAGTGDDAGDVGHQIGRIEHIRQQPEADACERDQRIGFTEVKRIGIVIQLGLRQAPLDAEREVVGMHRHGGSCRSSP